VLILLIAGRIPHPAVVALTLHVAADFTFQSPETALRKAECRRYLLVHSLSRGSPPGRCWAPDTESPGCSHLDGRWCDQPLRGGLDTQLRTATSGPGHRFGPDLPRADHPGSGADKLISAERCQGEHLGQIANAVGLTGRRGGGRGRDTMGDKDVEAKGVV
jgi:hypothetical protein